MFNHYSDFISHAISQVEELGIPVTDLEIDHLAYTTASKEEYDSLLPGLLKLGKLAAEDLVGGRRVGIARLNQPLLYKDREIAGMEIIEPAEGKSTESRLDHLEFVIPMGFNNFMAAHPDVMWDTTSMSREEYPHLKIKGFPSVKFHEVDIFETVERQKRRKET